TLASASITARAGSEQRGRFGPPSNEAVAPSTVIGASRSHRLRRHRRAVEGSTREGAGDEPYVALGDPEGVANVAGAITVHVTQRGIRYCIAEQTRAPTSNCAINRASPMFTTPSPF